MCTLPAFRFLFHETYAPVSTKRKPGRGTETRILPERNKTGAAVNQRSWVIIPERIAAMIAMPTVPAIHFLRLSPAVM